MPEPTPDEKPPLGPSAPRLETVLVVDDEEDILGAIRDTLEAYVDGIKVRTAPNGPAALDIIRSEPVDLIVTDYKMPRMTGLEFLHAARALVPNVPRIMITAFPDMELVLRAINDERISNFISKPLRREEIVGVVEAALAKRRAEVKDARDLAAAVHRLHAPGSGRA